VATAPSASTGTVTADEVKAAYLHKFVGFVDWPAAAFPTPSTPFVVAVAGAEGVADALARVVAGRPVLGRPMVVRRVARTSDVSRDVHVLFVGVDAWHELATWVAAVQQRPVLLVTDAPHGLESGAALAFVQVDERVRFEAAPGAADQNGLRLNARLLAVAERVIGGAP
jgi:hypothetical protein